MDYHLNLQKEMKVLIRNIHFIVIRCAVNQWIYLKYHSKTTFSDEYSLENERT
jgi:hypothetical protein